MKIQKNPTQLVKAEVAKEQGRKPRIFSFPKEMKHHRPSKEE